MRKLHCQILSNCMCEIVCSSKVLHLHSSSGHGEVDYGRQQTLLAWTRAEDSMGNNPDRQQPQRGLRIAIQPAGGQPPHCFDMANVDGGASTHGLGVRSTTCEETANNCKLILVRMDHSVLPVPRNIINCQDGQNALRYVPH